MVRLIGRIVGESDKAVRLEIIEDENSKLLGKVKWMPKSQLRLDGKEVGIVIPEWLYEEKANQSE